MDYAKTHGAERVSIGKLEAVVIRQSCSRFGRPVDDTVQDVDESCDDSTFISF